MKNTIQIISLSYSQIYNENIPGIDLRHNVYYLSGGNVQFRVLCGQLSSLVLYNNFHIMFPISIGMTKGTNSSKSLSNTFFLLFSVIPLESMGECD